MLIDTACSLAFYCQRCGRIQLRDVPLFNGQMQFVMECGNCGHEMGKITLRPRKGLELNMECGVCKGMNRQVFSWRQLRKLRFARLYCQHDNFELGYIGRWQDIAEFLDFNTAEYDALHPADGDGYIEHQQTLLEALNRIHDLAASGELECSCGWEEEHGMEIDILDNTLVYLSSFDGKSPWDDHSDEFWNHALEDNSQE